MCSALASLLGTQRSSFLYNTLLCEDGFYDADPVVIHRSIQRHYMRHFAVDQNSLLQRFQLDLSDLGSAATWEVFLLDPDVMVQAFLYPANGAAPTAVPRDFVEAIARAFQQSPAARALQADLSASLETPFLFEKFLYALSCGNPLAPGESGVSYRLLQVTPLSVYLQEFWTASSIPNQWRKVLLILIQKKADRPAMMGNFRPIGLLEVLRKVWTKMVTRRILPLLETHSVLQPNQCAFLPGRGTTSELIHLINVLEEVAENDLPVDLTTADVRGAFDSPERTAQ
jgi:hypothetical protein